MFADFLEFVLSVFRMVVTVFQVTDLGGFSYETVLVSILVLLLVVRAVFIIMK